MMERRRRRGGTTAGRTAGRAAGRALAATLAAVLAGAVWTPQAPLTAATAAAAGPATAVGGVGGAGGAAPKGFKLGGDPAKGRQVYASSCALCHGDAGDGRGEAAGVLSPRPSNLTDAARLGKLSDWDLYRVIRDGGPAIGLSAGMQAFKPLLPDTAVRNVASFVRTLAKGRRPPKP